VVTSCLFRLALTVMCDTAFGNFGAANDMLLYSATTLKTTPNLPIVCKTYISSDLTHSRPISIEGESHSAKSGATEILNCQTANYSQPLLKALY